MYPKKNTPNQTALPTVAYGVFKKKRPNPLATVAYGVSKKMIHGNQTRCLPLPTAYPKKNTGDLAPLPTVAYCVSEKLVRCIQFFNTLPGKKNPPGFPGGLYWVS
jgi:hypothetical protein